MKNRLPCAPYVTTHRAKEFNDHDRSPIEARCSLKFVELLGDDDSPLFQAVMVGKAFTLRKWCGDEGLRV
jgi:hypothetical protein